MATGAVSYSVSGTSNDVIEKTDGSYETRGYLYYNSNTHESIDISRMRMYVKDNGSQNGVCGVAFLATEAEPGHNDSWPLYLLEALNNTSYYFDVNWSAVASDTVYEKNGTVTGSNDGTTGLAYCTMRTIRQTYDESGYTVYCKNNPTNKIEWAHD
jgi:hypothetical protein